MKTIATTSMSGLEKAPIEASRVEKPPVERVAMACAVASKSVMPAM